MKVIDLCSGTGSFSLAFGENNVVFANDIEKKSKEIYDYNFKHKLTLADLHDIKTKDIPEHDILCCGFPCQPHNVPIIIDKLGIRKLTPRECFNLQGFPYTYKLPELAVSHLYKLAGNSISFPIIAELAKRILKVLE